MASTNLQMAYLAGSHVKRANTTRPGTSQWHHRRQTNTKTSLGANVAGSKNHSSLGLVNSFIRLKIGPRRAAEGHAEYTFPSTCPALLRESNNGAIMPRTSGLSGPSHANGQGRKPAHKTMISAPLSLKIGTINT